MTHPSRSPLAAIAALALLGGALSAALAGPFAQEDPNQPQIGLKITGGAVRQIPIAVTLPRLTGVGDSEAARAASLIQSVVSADLTFSGLFNVLPPSLYSGVTTVSAGRVPLREFAALSAQGVLTSTIGRKAGAGGPAPLVVEGLLFDSRSEALISGKRYTGEPALARNIAHRIANDIMLAYTGRSGVSLSQIAFVGKVGGAKEIFVMDYDGEDLKQITRNRSLNISPAWSPDGRRLAFISYRKGNPHLYVYKGDDGSLSDVSPRGSELCVAPEWSPDGNRIAFASSSAGDSEIFVLDVSSGSSRQVTFSRGSDSAPAWSPSGREIAFTSDRSGRPHIYLMGAEGANVRRLTDGGDYHDSAAWSPTGDRIAYTSRINGRFEIVVHDLASGTARRLTQNAGNNENPRWSADGRHLVFSSNRQGGYRLYTMDADGNRQAALRTSMEATMPDWSR